jgi:hypothetical protein
MIDFAPSFSYIRYSIIEVVMNNSRSYDGPIMTMALNSG